MNRKRLLIAHFYNEEYLLPFWIMHHSNLFDDAVLINNNSSDRSVEIIKTMAPNWKIIDSSFEKFNSQATDELIMQIENSHKNYIKITLNITEFLIINDYEKFSYFLENKKMIKLKTFLMCSVSKNSKISNLLEEENSGFWDDSYNLFLPYVKLNWTPSSRNRFIHSYPDGRYKAGRHVTKHKNIYNLDQKVAYIRWYTLSPWNDKFIKRKLQIQNTISDFDQIKGYSYQHFLTNSMLEKQFEYFKKISHVYPGKVVSQYKAKYFSIIRFLLKSYNFVLKKFKPL